MDGDDEKRRVDVWVVDERSVAAERLEEFADVLSEAETARANRYRRSSDRVRSIVARSMLRHALSLREPRCAPAQWRFEVTDKGMPVTDCAVNFNVTHTEGLVAVALARVPVGVDAEFIHRSTDIDLVGRRWFHASEVAIIDAENGEAKRRRFFEYWTLKEAYAKALGMGLAVPFRTLHFERDATIRLSIEGEPLAHWSFRLDDQISSEHIVAVAAHASDVDVVIRRGFPGSTSP